MSKCPRSRRWISDCVSAIGCRSQWADGSSHGRLSLQCIMCVWMLASVLKRFQWSLRLRLGLGKKCSIIQVRVSVELKETGRVPRRRFISLPRAFLRFSGLVESFLSVVCLIWRVTSQITLRNNEDWNKKWRQRQKAFKCARQERARTVIPGHLRGEKKRCLASRFKRPQRYNFWQEWRLKQSK